MKRAFILLLCFNLISCFKEPKKESKIGSSFEPTLINNSINVKNINTKDSLVDEYISQNDTKKEKIKLENNIINLETLINIIDKQADDFENLVINNNYYFDEIKTYEYFKVLYYKKNNGFISFAVDKIDNSSMGMIHLETNSKDFYLSMKAEAVELGFKYTDTKTFDKQISDNERLYNEYTNGKYNLSFIITNEPNKLGYSVGISKSNR